MQAVAKDHMPEGQGWEVMEQAAEFWLLNLAELAEQCTLTECDPICLAYGRPEICRRAGRA